MEIETLLSPVVVCAEAGEPLAAAARRMWAHDIGALPVLRGERLVGIITERDLVKAMAFGAGAGSTIAAHMTPNPVTVAPGDDAATVATRMLDLGVRHLPVTDGARLVGMVSARDLLMAAALAGRPAAGSSSSAGRARPGRAAV